MNLLNLLAVFMVGLLGSVHCVGMCGGIVSAFSMVPVKRITLAVAKPSVRGVVWRVVTYNVGRISSYALAGALAGSIAGGARALAGVSVAQAGGYWLANLMLVLLGLYLMDAWRGLAHLERAGQAIWQGIEPLTKRLLPLNSPFKMFLAGLLWGWLPCGMVYSMLLTAMFSGSALSGATVMFVFGLGTLPTLFAVGVLGSQLRRLMQRRVVRVASGLIVLSFGLLGMLRAANGLHANWFDAMCITPTTAGSHK